MPITNQIRSKSPSRHGRPLSELASYTEEEVDALVDGCQQDFPEIAPKAPPAMPATVVPQPVDPAVDLGQASQAKAEQGAKSLKDETGPIYLYAALAPLFGDQVTSASYRVYLKQLFQEAGNPTDPLERMIIEQLALAHHSIGRLHVKSASSKSVQEATGYIAAAARLMGEYRRSALALKSYRTPSGPSHVTVVKQQNLAVGEQQVALVEARNDRSPAANALPMTNQQESAHALPHHDLETEPQC